MIKIEHNIFTDPSSISCSVCKSKLGYTWLDLSEGPADYHLKSWFFICPVCGAEVVVNNQAGSLLIMTERYFKNLGLDKPKTLHEHIEERRILNSMEKYGTDLSSLPVDDDQKSIIEKLANGKEYTAPRNKKEAEELIEKLGSE